MEVISNAGLFKRHLHCFQMCMFVLFLLTRLFAITFIVLFYKVSPPPVCLPPSYIPRGDDGNWTDLLARLLSLLLELFGVGAWLNDISTFVHPSSCVCGSESVLYPVTMKTTYVLLCVGLFVLPATICQSPAERDSYTVSNLTISPCSFHHPLHA